MGITNEKFMPPKMPVIRQAAPNMPAVDACSGSTVLGQYIIAREEKYPLVVPKKIPPIQ